MTTSTTTLSPPTLPALLAAVEALSAGSPASTRGGMSWGQALVHSAQSIEYSMQGFPRMKPAWFRHSVGPLAFAVFRRRGAMRHDLAAPIPGAPPIEADVDPAQALRRLRDAVAAFLAWSGPLQPHFAYGALAKDDYERAHAMHLAEHLTMF